MCVFFFWLLFCIFFHGPKMKDRKNKKICARVSVKEKVFYFIFIFKKIKLYMLKESVCVNVGGEEWWVNEKGVSCRVECVWFLYFYTEQDRNFCCYIFSYFYFAWETVKKYYFIFFCLKLKVFLFLFFLTFFWKKGAKINWRIFLKGE